MIREILLDTETTGLDPNFGHRIVEIGCIEIIDKVKTGKIFHTYLNPEMDIPNEVYQIHGLSSKFLSDKPLFKDIVNDFMNFIKDATLVIHNAPFDIKFINAELLRVNHSLINNKIIDTLLIARKKFPGYPANLNYLCKKFNIDLSFREKHGALVDSELLYEVYLKLV